MAALWALALSWAAMTPSWATDAQAGRVFFIQQCALCHSAESGDGGGAQGPNLQGLFGRRAAADARFGYSEALRHASLSWDAENLERFLAEPEAIVPGTAMAIAVAGAADRANLIAYFRALGAGTMPAAPPPGAFSRPPIAAAKKQVDTDWKQDAPGRRYRIDPQKLSPPDAAASAVNFPAVVARPQGARLRLPTGFKVEEFASDLKRPRVMQLAPNGDIFVSESVAGRVLVLRPSGDGSQAETVQVFAQGLVRPYGIAFYPRGADPHWVYVAETHRVVRYAYACGDQTARGVPEIVVAQLAPTPDGGHVTRDLLFTADGRRMYVSVGSQSNAAESMPRKDPVEIRAWEAENGLGAPWGTETHRAAVLAFNVEPAGPPQVLANGIRNCVGLTLEPVRGDLWCTTNERDLLGDDLVPDYSTRVRQGAFYGWPWYYFGNNEDPRLAGHRPDLAGRVTVPDVPYRAHSAALHLAFYAPNTGRFAFPKEYTGDGFVTLHGSWNRSALTGYKVVRVRMKDGVPVGGYEDFLVGFIAEDGRVWGRPAGLLQLADGSLLVSDDGAGVIYRIVYEGNRR